MTDKTAYEKICKIDYKLDLNDPLKSYQVLTEKTIHKKMLFEGTPEYSIKMGIKVCNSVREAMWKLLFTEKKATKEQYEKAAALLKAHKEDAVFVNPAEYNRWIYKFRDELLKREMFDFWKNVVVAHELGVCWARDSDMYDDFDDPEPVNFYNFAGCEAAWLKEEENKPSATLNLTNVKINSSGPKSLKKISLANAEEDYKYNMVAQAEIDPDDEQMYEKIFTEVREILWQLLFGEAKLTEKNAKTAANLLSQYKLDACFYSPFDYNVWIVKVRDELLKRKYVKFWKIICEKNLGLCCYKDSDYFDDTDDTKPMEFYKAGAELIKKYEKK